MLRRTSPGMRGSPPFSSGGQRGLGEPPKTPEPYINTFGVAGRVCGGVESPLEPTRLGTDDLRSAGFLGTPQRPGAKENRPPVLLPVSGGLDSASCRRPIEPDEVGRLKRKIVLEERLREQAEARADELRSLAVPLAAACVQLQMRDQKLEALQQRLQELEVDAARKQKDRHVDDQERAALQRSVDLAQVLAAQLQTAGVTATATVTVPEGAQEASEDVADPLMDTAVVPADCERAASVEQSQPQLAVPQGEEELRQRLAMAERAVGTLQQACDLAEARLVQEEEAARWREEQMREEVREQAAGLRATACQQADLQKALDEAAERTRACERSRAEADACLALLEAALPAQADAQAEELFRQDQLLRQSEEVQAELRTELRVAGERAARADRAREEAEAQLAALLRDLGTSGTSGAAASVAQPAAQAGSDPASDVTQVQAEARPQEELVRCEALATELREMRERQEDLLRQLGLAAERERACEAERVAAAAMAAEAQAEAAALLQRALCEREQVLAQQVEQAAQQAAEQESALREALRVATAEERMRQQELLATRDRLHEEQQADLRTELSAMSDAVQNCQREQELAQTRLVQVESNLADREATLQRELLAVTEREEAQSSACAAAETRLLELQQAMADLEAEAAAFAKQAADRTTADAEELRQLRLERDQACESLQEMQASAVCTGAMESLPEELRIDEPLRVEDMEADRRRVTKQLWEAKAAKDALQEELRLCLERERERERLAASGAARESRESREELAEARKLRALLADLQAERDALLARAAAAEAALLSVRAERDAALERANLVAEELSVSQRDREEAVARAEQAESDLVCAHQQRDEAVERAERAERDAREAKQTALAEGADVQERQRQVFTSTLETLQAELEQAREAQRQAAAHGALLCQEASAAREAAEARLQAVETAAAQAQEDSLAALAALREADAARDALAQQLANVRAELETTAARGLSVEDELAEQRRAVELACGQAADASSARMQLQADLETVRRSLEEAREEAADALCAKEAAEAALAEALQVQAQAGEAGAAAAAAATAVTAELAQVRAALDAAREEAAAAAETRAAAEAELAKSQQTLEVACGKSLALGAARAAVEADLAEARRRLDAAREEGRAEVQRAVVEAQREAQLAREEAAALVAARDGALVRLQEVTENLVAERAKQHVQLHEEQKELSHELEELRVRSRELTLTMHQFKQENELLMAENRSLRDAAALFEGDLEKVSDRHAQLLGHTNKQQKIRYTVKLNEECQRLRAELNKARSRLAHLDGNRKSDGIFDYLSAFSRNPGGCVEQSPLVARVQRRPLGQEAGGTPCWSPQRAATPGSSSCVTGATPGGGSAVAGTTPRRPVPARSAATTPCRAPGRQVEDWQARAEEAIRRCRLQERALERLGSDFHHLTSLVERAMVGDEAKGDFVDVLQRLRAALSAQGRGARLSVAEPPSTPRTVRRSGEMASPSVSLMGGWSPGAKELDPVEARQDNRMPGSSDADNPGQELQPSVLEDEPQLNDGDADDHEEVDSDVPEF